MLDPVVVLGAALLAAGALGIPISGGWLYTAVSGARPPWPALATPSLSRRGQLALAGWMLFLDSLLALAGLAALLVPEVRALVAGLLEG